MNKRQFSLYSLAFALLLGVLAACSAPSSPADTPSTPTAINIAPEFVTFYVELGGNALLGQPISWAFQESPGAPLVQYFSAVRLEYLSGALTVAPLGEWALMGASEAVRVDDVEGGRYFPETDQTISGDFLAFYEANQGQALLGTPITAVLDEDGMLVQYFVNGRLQKRPELPAGQQVVLSPLGQAHFETANVQYAYRTSLLARPVPSASVTSADVFAYVEAPVLYAGDEQVLHVTVLTEDGRPIPELTVTAAMSYGETAVGLTDLGITDEKSNLETTLDVSTIPPEQDVKIIISVFSPTGALIGTDTLFFKTWW
jgi:hypothetical protein